jgi:hypothetical protein
MHTPLLTGGATRDGAHKGLHVRAVDISSPAGLDIDYNDIRHVVAIYDLIVGQWNPARIGQVSRALFSILDGLELTDEPVELLGVP